jgi:hypothetical protein
MDSGRNHKHKPLQLFVLIFSDITAVLYNLLSFWLALILQTPCSITGPHTFLKFFLPHVLLYFSAKDHVSQLTVKMGKVVPVLN